VFWERLCHLDKGEDFERAKGEFRKFKFVEILDDPRVAIELPYVAGNVDIEAGRADIIYAMLANLESATSLKGFYSTSIRINGTCRQITGCVDLVRRDLAKREKQYIEFVRNIWQLFSREQALHMRDKDKHRHILALAKGYAVDIAKQGGSLTPESRAKIIDDTYIYIFRLYFIVC
jgi:hypothetical protein